MSISPEPPLFDRHDLHSYATDQDTGLVTVTCACGWRSPPAESIPKGVELWTAHVSDAYPDNEPGAS